MAEAGTSDEDRARQKITPETGNVEARVSGPDGPWLRDHDSLRAALDWVLTCFATTDTHSAHIRLDPRKHRRHSSALLYPRPDAGHIVIAGRDEMAAVVRQMFPRGDWRLLPLPQPGIPLETLRRPLGAKLYGMLSREGFAAVEEVAATPDRALLDVRGMGAGSLAAVRTVLAETAAAAQPAASVTLSEVQVRELRALLTLLAGYARRRGAEAIVSRIETFLTGLDPKA